jgi:hypothetical protein
MEVKNDDSNNMYSDEKDLFIDMTKEGNIMTNSNNDVEEINFLNEYSEEVCKE